MTALQLIPIILSIILLAAHLLRYVGPVGALIMLLLLVVLGVTRAWAARTVQVVLILGALEWIRTIVYLAGLRSQAGEPFLRMTIILGCVMLFTLLSALLFRTATLRERYRLGGDQATTGDGDAPTARDGDALTARDGDAPPPVE